MPFWIEGWVEVARSTDLTDEHAWRGVVQLDNLIDVGDAVSERLFGLSNRCVAGEYPVESFAAHRGIPANPSSEVRHQLDWYASRGCADEIGGHTHTTWAELKTVRFSEQELEDSDWVLVFDLIKQLEQRFEATHIRFVVWYSW